MSGKDKLDVFMESQLVVNQINAETMKALGVTVADLEKHSVEMKQLVSIVNDAKADIKTNTDDIAELKLTSNFVKDAKWVFRAVILALIVGTGGLIWQLINPPQSQINHETLKALSELIIKSNNNFPDKER